MNYTKTTSDIIRGLREDKDLKQCEIAKIINSTQQQYSRYELGISDIPAGIIIKLADYYDVSTDYILGRLLNSKSYSLINSTPKDSITLSILSNINDLSQNEKTELFDYINFLRYKRNSNC